MPKKKPKKTQTQEAYEKELRRIKRFIREARKRGYSFPETAVPPRPKRVTKQSVGRLQKIRPEALYKKAGYTDPATGLTVPGLQGRQIERARAAKKAAETRKIRLAIKKGFTMPGHPPSEVDSVLTYLEELLDKWQPADHWDNKYRQLKERDKNILSNVLRGAISRLGRQQVARNVQEHADIVKELAFHVCYGSSDFKFEDIEGDIVAITQIINGRKLSALESMEMQDEIDQSLGYENPG